MESNQYFSYEVFCGLENIDKNIRSFALYLI